MEEFRKKPLEDRKKKSAELIAKDQNRAPIIVDKAKKSNLGGLKKHKYGTITQIHHSAQLQGQPHLEHHPHGSRSERRPVDQPHD